MKLAIPTTRRRLKSQSILLPGPSPAWFVTLPTRGPDSAIHLQHLVSSPSQRKTLAALWRFGSLLSTTAPDRSQAYRQSAPETRHQRSRPDCRRISVWIEAAPGRRGHFPAWTAIWGGFNYQITPRFFLRADFRETLSPQPDYWTKSYPTIRKDILEDPSDSVLIKPLQRFGPLRQQVATLGFGISF